MSSNALESEDLLNVRLVRMEDVQPSRELIETCVISNLVFNNNECVVNDEDSNIGSMVSIQSEDIADNGSDAELIVPDVLDPLYETQTEVKVRTEAKVVPRGSWPTLEILPGGVIKRGDKMHEEPISTKPNDGSEKKNEMMYACAKCSQSFKYLFSLVKHVKWHEEEKKKQKDQDSGKLSTTSDKDDYVCKQPKRKKVLMSKTTIKKIPKRLRS